MEELCCWGCGQVAVLPKTKYSKGMRCTERCYDCPGYKQKTSHKVPWNKGLTKETSETVRRQADSQRGKPGTCFGHSEETKRKISESMKGNRNANHRGDRQTYYNGIRMDSKWEYGVAKYLDDNHVEWKYSEKGYRLSDGRYYYPDFFIYENGIFQKLIEVKGYFREENKAKFEMFLKEYPEVQIDLWMSDELKKRNIINREGYVYL